MRVTLISPEAGPCVKCNATSRRLEKHGLNFEIIKLSSNDDEISFWTDLGVASYPIVIIHDAPKSWVDILKCREVEYHGEIVLFWNDLRYDTIDSLARLVES